MDGVELFGGGDLDLFAECADFLGFVGGDGEFEGCGVDDDVGYFVLGDVDGYGVDVFDFDWGVEVVYECWLVGELDVCYFVVLDLVFDGD